LSPSSSKCRCFFQITFFHVFVRILLSRTVRIQRVPPVPPPLYWINLILYCEPYIFVFHATFLHFSLVGPKAVLSTIFSKSFTCVQPLAHMLSDLESMVYPKDKKSYAIYYTDVYIVYIWSTRQIKVKQLNNIKHTRVHLGSRTEHFVIYIHRRTNKYI
jgi:hypothetical protein